MEFWDLFIEESLQSPWAVMPINEASQENLEVRNAKAFIFEKDLPSEAYEMLSKMIGALNLKSEEVSLVEVSSREVSDLKMIGEPKKIVFFGRDFPGRYGQLTHWYGHQVVQTHSLSHLLEKPESKRETWNHLKKFAGMQ